MRTNLFFIIISCFLTSCVTLNTMHYSISNKDGSGIPNNNSFSVSYPNAFTLNYQADGSCKVTNDNDSTLYIDLGESYWIDLDGIAKKMFDNQVVTTTATSTTGSSFNLGGAASVLGAGPGLQALANSTNVGSSQTSGTTITQYNDRYIGIPPYSSIVLSTNILGFQEPIKKNNGHYDLNKASESSIISYTFSPNDPHWTMVRNQFVLDYIDVKKVNKGYINVGSTSRGPIDGVYIPISNSNNEVCYGKWNSASWIGYGALIVGELALLILLIASIGS